MIHEDFRLNLNHLEPCLDLSKMGYNGPFPVEVHLFDQQQQLVLHHHFTKPPLAVIMPSLKKGHYTYQLQKDGQCLKEGSLQFP